MEKEIYQLMKTYGAMMTSQGYTAGDEAQMFLKGEQGIWSTCRGAALSCLSEKDICFFSKTDMTEICVEEGTSLALQCLMALKESKALLISQTPYCQRCLKEGKTIRAVLDDMAQIIGPQVEIVSERFSSLMKVFEQADACFAAKAGGGGYTVTIGRSLYEAVIGMMVLEKSAEVFLKAEVLGGGKAIPLEEVRRMRKMYKQQYSKMEQAARRAEEKGIK